MDNNTLHAIARKEGGKGPARQLRFQGRIPGVFYYRSDLNIPFSVDYTEFKKLIHARHALINLHIEGHEPRECVVREIQIDPIEDTFLHVDLMGIKRGQKLTVTVPVRLIGIPEGVKTGGGILQTTMNEFDIESLPRHIPSVIEIDVSDLEIGSSRTIDDLDFPDLKFLYEPDAVIATIVPPTVIKETVVEDEEEEVEEVEEGEEKTEEGKEKPSDKTEKKS